MLSPNKIFEQIITGEEFEEYRGKWATERRDFKSIPEASIFFIFVMLNMGVKIQWAKDGSKHFVNTHFPNDSIWHDIAKKRQDSLTNICQKGFDGKAYATNYNFNTFPVRLKANAKIMIDVYSGDPRKIWDVSKKDVENIYARFKKFHGIGDALAKIAQIMLVRDKGIAGGIESKQYLKVKPDIHVNKVLFRMGLSKNESAKGTIECVEDAEVSSQADLDIVLLRVGERFCKKSDPNCTDCPLKKMCKKIL